MQLKTNNPDVLNLFIEDILEHLHLYCIVFLFRSYTDNKLWEVSHMCIQNCPIRPN